MQVVCLDDRQSHIQIAAINPDERALSAFYAYGRNNKPQELPYMAALRAWFCWPLTARLGSSVL